MAQLSVLAETHSGASRGHLRVVLTQSAGCFTSPSPKGGQLLYTVEGEREALTGQVRIQNKVKRGGKDTDISLPIKPIETELVWAFRYLTGSTVILRHTQIGKLLHCQVDSPSNLKNTQVVFYFPM